MDSICALVFACGAVVGGAVVAIGFVMAREAVDAGFEPRPNRRSRYHEEFEPPAIRRR